MEKYSRFRDEGTGIAPFQTARSNSQEYNFMQTALISIISLFSTIFTLLGLITYFSVFHWILPAALSKQLLRLLVFFPLRLFYFTLQYEGERKSSVRKKSIQKAQPGDVILSNFISPLDPLVYKSHLGKTVFAFPTADGKFEQSSLLMTVFRALSARPLASSGQPLNSIGANAKKAGAIVIVFVEGTTSNGRGLLTLKHLGASDISRVDGSIFAAAIKFTPASATSPTSTSILSYIWSVSRATWWYMVSIKISGEALAKSTLNRDEVSKTIARIGRLRTLGDRLDVKSKQEYSNLKSKR